MDRQGDQGNRNAIASTATRTQLESKVKLTVVEGKAYIENSTPDSNRGNVEIDNDFIYPDVSKEPRNINAHKGTRSTVNARKEAWEEWRDGVKKVQSKLTKSIKYACEKFKSLGS